jgi:hypothetical protein
MSDRQANAGTLTDCLGGNIVNPTGFFFRLTLGGETSFSGSVPFLFVGMVTAFLLGE